ncbi:MAG: cell division protein ZapA [Saprospiraceae bacterium]
MDNTEQKSLTVTIAGRVFPVKITVEEEQYFSELIDEVNGKILSFQTQYPTRDKLDHVIMALLTFLNDAAKSKQNTVKVSENSLQTLMDISKMLDNSSKTIA